MTAAQGPVRKPVGVSGPVATPGQGSNLVPHRHGRHWYLCDRSYVRGRRSHLIRERCGLHRPTLFRPELRSGVAEQLLPQLEPRSFDLIYLDPPYGTTSGDWDRAPEWYWLAEAVAPLLKPTGQVVLHGQGIMAARAAVAFESYLAHRFPMVWVKSDGYDGPVRSAILNGPAPLHAHENIYVFRRKDAKVGSLTYNAGAMHHRGTPRGAYSRTGSVPQWGWKRGPEEGKDTGWRHPIDVVFLQPPRSGQLYAQKPIDLVRYMILLLTNPGDRILDPYAGSGTTLLAAYGLGRRSLGLEASPRSWGLLQRNLGGILTRRGAASGRLASRGISNRSVRPLPWSDTRVRRTGAPAAGHPESATLDPTRLSTAGARVRSTGGASGLIRPPSYKVGGRRCRDRQTPPPEGSPPAESIGHSAGSPDVRNGSQSEDFDG